MIPVPMNILIIVLISLIVFFGAVILYDTHRFVIREYTVESAKIGHDCTICLLSDLHGKVYTMPELIDALGHVSERIRVIPMTDDESGTCIVELPDVILDASVSTQMGNIRELLSGVGLDD